jgi:NADPH:quinone reductase-like Zn-dependent oxidoreductase
MMKAVVQHRYGGSEQLEVREIATPVPDAGEVLIRVRAAGIDRGTWHLMTGLPLVMRLGFGLRGPKQPIPGRDLAGVVEAVGDDVDGFSPGDEVIGTADGSFAEYALAPATRLAHKPAGLTFEQAAVLPVSGLTAVQAVRKAGVRPGHQVLIIGASGGVGSYAVQIAAASGAMVTGVCSGSKADFVRSLGADQVIDYARTEIDHDGRRYDVIIDIAGNRSISQLRRSLTPTGCLVVVGGENGGRWFGGIHRQLAGMILSPLVRHRLTAFLSSESSTDLTALADQVDRGQLRPVLDRTYTLDEAAKAIDHLAAGHTRGKIAITV